MPASTGRAATSPGVIFINWRVEAKRLELLRQTRAQGDDNRHDRATRTVRKAEAERMADVQAAARESRQQLVNLDVGSERRDRNCLRSIRPTRGLVALFVGTDALFLQSPRPSCCTGGPPCTPGDLLDARRRREWRPHAATALEHADAYRHAGIYVGTNSQRREARRPAGHAVNQIRVRASTSRPLGRSASTSRDRLLALADEVIE